jgi:hypothetical protein
LQAGRLAEKAELEKQIAELVTRAR